ncbi:MAG: DegT/DnrJ/EryC1/StrS family aminotransferase [Deltaproteobacteria bacterium]
MDIILHTDIVIDLCDRNSPQAAASRQAIRLCQGHGGRAWIHVGSAQGLGERLRTHLLSEVGDAGQDPSARVSGIIRECLAGVQWLAALSGEGDVLDAKDPEAAQLLRAIDRFPPGGAAILTRNTAILETAPGQAMTPEAYCERTFAPPSIPFVDLAAQQDEIRPHLEKNLHRVLLHGRYVSGPEVTELEDRLARYAGVGHCVAVSSGTDALLIALMALGIGPGDEVITTPFTFIATAETIAILGARPVFVDIDPATYNIDPQGIHAAITPRTRAILPVSLYGQCADFDRINEIARRHGLAVVEDAAQSFGATYKGRPSCSLSTIGCTSFFPSKPMGCYGEGGACLTDDADLAEKMRRIRDHGQDRRYHHAVIGLNGRLDTLQAAVLLAKLEILPREIQARGRIGQRYSVLLSDVAVVPHIEPWNTSVYAQYTIQVEDRERVQAKLHGHGIPTAVHYPIPLHMQPAFSYLGYAKGDFPVAERAAERVLSLPMHPYLKEEDLERICRAVRQAVRE